MRQATVSAETQMLRSTLERFLRDHHPGLGGCHEAEPAGWKELAIGGWLDLMVTPPAEGLVGAVHVVEAFGAVPTPGPVAVVAGYLLPLLDGLEHPTAQAVAAELRAGGLVTAPLPSLAHASVAPGARRLTPSPDLVDRGNGLTGVVESVPFTRAARVVLAPAVVAGQLGLAVVRTDRRGVEATDAPGMDLRYRVGSVSLDDVVISPEEFITGDELEHRVAAAGSRLSLFLDAEAVGAAEEVLGRTVRYVSEREQFGRAVGSFQAVRHKVADMGMLVENARALTSRAAEAVDAGSDDAQAEVWASRLCAGEAGKRVCELAIQAHGGAGFTWEQGLHVFYRAGMFARSFLSDRQQVYAALAAYLDDRARSLAGTDFAEVG